MSWEESTAVGNVWAVLLESRGYQVTLQQVDAGPAFDATARSQIDVLLEMWPNYHAEYMKKYEGKIASLGQWYEPTDINLTVPDYVTNVNSIADLRGKESEFGDRIVGIEAGSTTMKLLAEDVAPAYGLTGYDLVQSSTPAMLAELRKAVAEQRPIVVSLWKPHWAYAELPLKSLADPQKKFGGAGTIDTVAAVDFARENPDVAEMFGRFSLDEQQLADLMLSLERAGKGNERAGAQAWIDANRQLTDRWLGAGR
ncbi:glycine betaine ABC transporter substrate-binding protein [Pseudonocardia sp. C8]|nr:glycine betaine ABC transporter substrate-binding protein [Pseudonocardia sp. C8]